MQVIEGEETKQELPNDRVFTRLLSRKAFHPRGDLVTGLFVRSFLMEYGGITKFICDYTSAQVTASTLGLEEFYYMGLKIFGNGIVDVKVIEYFLKVVDPAVQ